MKVSPDQLSILRGAIAPLDSSELRARYRAGDFPRADAVKDLDKRYRWDLLHAAGSWRLTSPLYENGCNDAHIDTALRAIVPALEG
jgi:hypothetical protein